MPIRIVIVGAGPAGAMLAYLLASRGGDRLRVTLTERQHDFEREFRGEVLMPSGIDIIRQAGLLEPFQRVPKRLLRRALILDHNKPLTTLDLERAVGPGAAFTAVSQPAMLEMLVAEAGGFANFEFERGVAMRDLVVEGDRVRGVHVVSEGRARTIEADLVIGADGRASATRKHAGLDAIRRPQSFDIVWCKAPAPPYLSESDLHTARVFIGRGHFALLFPTYDDRLQIAWVIRKGSMGELRRAGIEHWIDQMAGHVSDDLARHLRANLHAITSPFLLDVICDLMPKWTRPGLLLIGDAAHPMSPVGGQGINIALRDAVVAANLLIEACRSGNADTAALDRAADNVQRERLPEVDRIQRMQQLPPRFLFAWPIVTNTLLAILPVLVKSGIATSIASAFLRRFAYGVGQVRLRV